MDFPILDPSIRANLSPNVLLIRKHELIYCLLVSRSCSINGETVSVGDSVAVLMDNDNPVAVCELLELFEKFCDDPHRAKVSWYYRHSDLPTKIKSIAGIIYVCLLSSEI